MSAGKRSVEESWLRDGRSQTAPGPVSADPGRTINNEINTGVQTMRTFKKSSKLDNVLYDVRGPVVDEAARMEEDGTQILKLNIGNPAPFGFRTPERRMKSSMTCANS